MSKQSKKNEKAFEISTVELKEAADNVEAQVWGVSENSEIMFAYAEVLDRLSIMLDRHAAVAKDEGLNKRVPARLKKFAESIASLSVRLDDAAALTEDEEESIGR